MANVTLLKFDTTNRAARQVDEAADTLLFSTLDRSTGSTWSIGATTGSSGTVGRTGQALSLPGNVTVGGNLTVNGTTTTVNSTIVEIGDNLLRLRKDLVGAESTNAGIGVERGSTGDDALLLWDFSNTEWAASLGDSSAANPSITSYASFKARKLASQAATNEAAIATAAFSLTGANASSLVDLAGTWNTSGTPTAIKLNVTDTASNAASLLLDLQVGGTSKAKVTKGGAATFEGLLTANAGVTVNGAALTINNVAITQTTGGQVTFAGNVDANAGLDVAGANVTLAGVDLKWTADGGANIGAAGANRPDNIYVKTSVVIGSSITFSTAEIQGSATPLFALSTANSTTPGQTNGGMRVRPGTGTAADASTVGGDGGPLTLSASAGGAGFDSALGNPGSGGGLNLSSGTGGAANAGTNAHAGGTGGSINLFGGQGGAGVGTVNGGAGGQSSVRGGHGGTGGGGMANGGDMLVDGGAAIGAGTSGRVLIASGTLASSPHHVEIGNITNNPKLTQLGTGQVEFNGNVDAKAGLDVSGAALTIANQAITQTTGGQVTFAGNVDANAGIDVVGALTQATGAVTLTANAASAFTTSAGALTLTAAAASTWSTSAGDLTLSGFTGMNLQSAGATRLAVAAAALTVQAGVTLATTGTGNINLPQNANARFQIEGAATTATVTAANLTTLTNGSNADALHTHTSLTAADIKTAALTNGETSPTTIPAGTMTYISAANTVKIADSGAVSTARVIGSPETTITAAPGTGKITVYGIIESVVTGVSAPAAGAMAYLGTGADAGKAVSTPPTAAGTVVFELGIMISTTDLLLMPRLVAIN